MALEIYTSHDMPPRALRVFAYGVSGTGKTTFAGTFPNPIFLSAGNEGGDTTLRGMPNITVVKINSSKDMEEAVKLVEVQHRQYGWQTVVLDSVTFYSDIVIGELTRQSGVMNQRDWGSLDVHLQKWLLPTLHRMPLHVVWIALEQEKTGAEGSSVSALPMLYGKTAHKLPAATDMILHAEVVQVPSGDSKQMVSKFIMRTRPWLGAIARDRFGQAFAQGFIEPHFGEIAQRIGPYIGYVPTQVSQ